MQVDLVFARSGSPSRPEWFEFGVNLRQEGNRRILLDGRPHHQIGSDSVSLGRFAERRCHAGKVTCPVGGIDFLARALCIRSSMHAEIMAASVNKKRCTGPVRIAYS